LADAPSSRIPGFYKLPVAERVARVAAFAGLSPEDLAPLGDAPPSLLEAADRMIENVGGVFHFPVGFAANFRVDGRDRILPMVIEEPSVVAAASNAARMLRGGEGILTDATPPLMIGQIQLAGVPDLEAGAAALREAAPALLDRANESQSRLVARGGGARELRVRTLRETPDGTSVGPMLVVHLLVDVRDAMGANLVNAMAETLAGECERITGGAAFLRILSNLADERLVTAVGRVPINLLAKPGLPWDGAQVADRVEAASVFAEVDPYRAATHNKGIMNGVDAFLIATGQDWRAVEAGAHAYAARDGRYTALARWRRDGDELVGRITLPMQVGIVGGVTRVHPVVKALLKVVAPAQASDVGRLAAAVGLAQNLAAILALATEGIQRGHMSLHARNLAASVGARGAEIDRIVAEMIRRRAFTHAAAEEIFEHARAAQSGPAKTTHEAPEPEANGSLTLAEVTSLLAEHREAVEALMRASIPRRDGDAGGLAPAVDYQIATGGKRLRVALTLCTYQAFGKPAAEVRPFAAAVEMVHNATLIHDDLQRGVRLRRGRDSVWARFGRDLAVNCGDGMLYGAIRCLRDLPQPTAQVQDAQARLVDYLLQMVDAEIADRRLRQARDLDADAWLTLTRDRIGGLFRTAVVGAAVLAGAEHEVVASLDAIGAHIGVAFMVQDELLDVLGDTVALRGAAIRHGGRNLLVTHALGRLARGDGDVGGTDEAQELRDIVAKPFDDTGDGEVARALELLARAGSFAYAVELIRDAERHIESLARDLPPAVRRLATGVVGVFLAPVLERLEAP